jgi:DNA-binding GntR family transcriptional regulator
VANLVDDASPAPDSHVDLARRRLRAAIVRGDLAAGSVITQPELSEAVGVGRTPLREAIRTLQQEGLVLSQPNRRVRIADLSVVDLEDLYALRVIVEAAAVRMTVGALSTDQVADLHALLAKMDHYGAQEDFDRFEAPHRAFHALLVCNGGARVRRLAEELSDHTERYRRAYLAVSDASRAEHQAILSSAVAGDAEACAQHVISHYSRTVQTLAKKIDGGHRLDRFLAAEALARVPSAAGAGTRS